MRNNRPSRRSRSNTFSRLFAKPTPAARKAPRRRDLERLEERQMLTIVGTPTNEPYFQDQWHLQATGQFVEQPNSPTFLQSRASIDANVVGAWELGYTGAGVQVAVVDGGHDLSHEDLSYVLLTGPNGELLDLINLDNDPSFIDPTDAHGTAVAGIIGARDNDVGTVGIAYQSDIVPVRLILSPGELPPDTTNFDASFAQAIVQFAGIPSPGDDRNLLADQIVDVFNRSYGPPDDVRTAAPLSPLQLQAYRDAATLGRGSWLDLDGDGIFEPDEIDALGAINIVAAGNGAGTGFIDPFTSIGFFDSSQYDQSANTRYSIAVGGVDFDGSYTNSATGARGSFAETGTNVLLVAPTQTAAPSIGTDVGLGAGIWTTDFTGEDGYNFSPVFGQEVEPEPDFFVDTNYTSTFGGTSAAAPIVSGVVALMLEANSELSYRDVQQILLMSAQQVDQFDESWIINPYKYFEDIYEIPAYLYQDLDTDGDLTTTEVENAIVPNYTLPDYIRGFFLNDPDIDVPFAGAALNELSANGVVSISGEPDPLLGWGVDFNPNNADGIRYLTTPISGTNKGISTTTVNVDEGDVFAQGSAPVVNGELQFETGVGFTVSHGFGDYLEEYGYAHGLVDAELAVRLAEAWETYDLYLDDEVTITTAIDGGAAPLQVQARADIDLGTGLNFEVPGGVVGSASAGINAAWYAQWLVDYSWSNVTVDGNDVGSVITGGPWYNPTGQLNDLLTQGSDRGVSRIPFRIDPALTEDFLSLEWLEFTTQITSGDVDALRLSIISPDGTQSELNPYRLQIDGTGDFPQQTQTQQGVGVPGDEILSEDVGGFGLTDYIDGSERTLINEVDLDDAVPAGTSWTWSTNRHWGELFSVEAQNADNPNNSVEGQWYLVMENWGDAAVNFGGQYEIALHGTRATGNRIQGKLGVDDNAQGREGQDSDEVFNFDRNVTFGTITIDGFNTVNVVVDDATDSVFYNNNYYETVDDSTGEVFRHAVIDKLEYEALAEVTRGRIAAPGTDRLFYEDAIANGLITGFALPTISEAQAATWYAEYGERLQLTSVVDPLTGDTNGDAIVDDADALAWEAELADRVFTDMVAAETLEPELGFNLVPGTSVIQTTIDDVGNAFTFQNWDYNQESFAANVVVQATQFRTDYDSTGAVIGRTATGVVDSFVTGADGNYWFDVEATPQIPQAANFPTTAAFDAALATWLNDFGFTFDYEISIAGDDGARVIDRSYAGQVEAPRTEARDVFAYGDGVQFNAGAELVQLGGGAANYQSGGTYQVDIFASPTIRDGQTTVIRDINFLLTVDPALTNVDVSGQVFRDRDGDGTQNSLAEESIAGATVFYDANTNGTLDAGEVSAVTGADGSYSFTIAGLTTPQNAQIRVDASTIPSDLTFFQPAGGIQTVGVTPGSPVTASFSLQKLGGEPAQVTGLVFEDVNQDTIQDANEVGVDSSKSVRVYIDLNGNDVFDDGVDLSTFTQADGSFIIESDTEGEFELRIELDGTGLVQTTPTPGSELLVNLVEGVTVAGLAFGVFDGRNQDYGDLFVDPSIGANFPTLLEDNGARHVVVPGMRLGARNDIDNDGFQAPTRDPNLDGLGDDFDGSDDEDGVRIVSGGFTAGSDLQFAIEAYGQGAVLNAWIDFNGNGQWEAHEQVFTNLSDIAFGPNGEAPSNPVPAITVPDLQQVGQDADDSFLNDSVTSYAARFRWGPFGLGPAGSANAGEVEDYLFTATPPIIVTGSIRDDVDGDGVFEGTDPGVGGVRVFYDRNVDGIVDSDEPRAVTNPDGSYRLEINTATTADITLRIDLDSLAAVEPAFTPLMPINGIFNQIVDPSEAITADFLVGAPQGVVGTVFSDANQSAGRDASESGFGGIVVEVFEDTDNDGTFESFLASTLTDATGSYRVPIESVGDYEVRLNLTGRQFLTQTLPAASGTRAVTVTAGAFATVGEFGVFDAVPTFTLDFGDLIVDGTQNFPTTLADDGARHALDSGVFLGTVAPDADPGTFESSDATADDTLFSPDDEDGVQMQSNIAADSIVRIDVTATGGSDNRLHAWIDFNNDGDWDDAGEQITAPGGNTLPSGQTTQLVIDTTGIDVDETATDYAARFRWGQGITGFTGLATSGEVEDYRLPRVFTTDPTGTLASDFNGDGVVDLLDLDVLGANFGAGPGATKAQGDANEDGNVDLLDLDILGSEFGSVATSSSIALATASNQDNSIDPEGVPPLVLHPVGDDLLEPVVLDANAFAPLLRASFATEAAVDESLAVDTDAAETGDALDAALLEWSLDGVADESAEEANAFDGDDAEAEENEDSDELLAQVFAF